MTEGYRVVTGRTEDAHHVRPMDDAAIYRSLYGTSLPYAVFVGEGGEFSTTVSDYTATVMPGILQMQGYVVRLESTCVLESSTIAPGYKRMDIIAMEYSFVDRSDESGGEVETFADAKLILIEGQAWSYSTDVINDKSKWAQVTPGDIDSGENHQVALWGVLHAKTTGGTTSHQLVDLRPFTPSINIETLNATVAANSGSISTLKNSVSALTTKINNINTNGQHITGSSFHAYAFCAGHITSSGTQLYFFIPTKPIRGTFNITKLSIGVRHVDGGYVGARQNAFDAAYPGRRSWTTQQANANTQINTVVVLKYKDDSGNIITNGAFKTYFDVSKCSYSVRDGGISVLLSVKDQYTTNDHYVWKKYNPDGGTTLNPVKNNTPIAVTAQVYGTVS